MTSHVEPTTDEPAGERAPSAGAEADLEWTAPGPGSWSLDATHISRPIGRFAEATLVEPYAEGFRRGMRLVGSPLDTIELAVVNGWPYTRVKPLGGPDDPSGGPPPKLVMSLLFRFHPELRRRHRTAKSILEERSWSPLVERWEHEVKPVFRARLDAVASIDPTGSRLAELSDDELIGHLEAIAGIGIDATENHFANSPLGGLLIGELLRLADDHGLTGAQAMSTLAGYSEPVREATTGADHLVAALREASALDALDGPADGLFARLAAAGTQPREALDQYLRTVGVQLAGGESVADRTVAECPDVVQSLLRRRVEGHDQGPALRAAADTAATQLADELPAGSRASWHRAVSAARAVAPLRDDDAAPIVEAMGRARLALLEVGRRLVARGIADRPDDAFELRPGEIGSTLAGRGVTARELQAHVELRQRQALLSPPSTLGPEQEPPPLELFPPAVARVVASVVAFVERFDAAGDGPTAEGRGHGVSAGRVTGRACVVGDLDDLGRIEPGDIIVTRMTSPTFNSVLAIAGGVVTETGGSICHAAVMSRELGIPGVVGYAEAMTIPDGAMIVVDGDSGIVRLLDEG